MSSAPPSLGALVPSPAEDLPPSPCRGSLRPDKPVVGADEVQPPPPQQQQQQQQQQPAPPAARGWAAARGAPPQRRVDYAAEGRALLERVNLGLTSAPERYAPANPVYRHPTGAALFVGNAACAASVAHLDGVCEGSRHIVFCQNGDGRMSFAGDAAFRYHQFPVGLWRSELRRRTPADALAFFRPAFAFVDEALAAGAPVLIHCLAGAHRAGTAGIACLMHLCALGAAEATATAKLARPAINPIGDFPALLKLLDEAMRKERKKQHQQEGQEQQQGGVRGVRRWQVQRATLAGRQRRWAGRMSPG